MESDANETGGKKKEKIVILRSDGEAHGLGDDVLAAAGEALEGALTSALSNREHVVMVRVNTEMLEKLDMLVECSICTSRSSAAAFILQEGIQANASFFASVEEATKKMVALKSDLKRKAHPASGDLPHKEDSA